MKILLVEDHPVFREGLVHVLRGLGDTVDIVAVASAEAAITAGDAHRDVDLVLLDLTLPGIDGVAALDAIRQAHPLAAILVVSASEAPEDVRRSMRAGARGYVAKTSPPDVMLRAVRTVLDGAVYVPTVMLRHEAVDAGTGDIEAAHPLTNRELDVLRLVCAGKPNKAVARDLGISEGTVRAHLTSIFRALGVASRTQAILAAQSRRLVER